MDASEVARRHDEAWNTKNLAARKDCYSSDVEVVMPGGMQLHGIDEVLAMEQVFWEALPDSQVKTEREISSGEFAVNEGVMLGTQTGPFRTPQGELPPSGNSIAVRYATIKHVVGGKLVSEHLYFDQMEFLTQLGAMGQPPPA